MPKELSVRKEQIQETSLSLASAGLFARNILLELRILQSSYINNQKRSHLPYHIFRIHILKKKEFLLVSFKHNFYIHDLSFPHITLCLDQLLGICGSGTRPEARNDYPNPGAGYSTAYRFIEAGKRKQLKDEIRRSEHREYSYIAHRDTLRQLLNDQSIFINRIQYENSERLIDYTDSTDVIKIAHFRKDGSIRITDSPEVVTLHDARSTKKVKWKKVR